MHISFIKRLAIFSVVVILNACGSSSSTPAAAGSDETTDTELADLVTFVKWAGHAWDDLVAMLGNSKNVTVSFPIDCAGGGTIDLNGSIIEINDCTETDNGTAYVTRGSYTITESGSLTTHSWDQDIIADSTTFTSTGSISFNTEEDLIAFDYSAIFASGTFRLTGIVGDNADGTSDVTFSVLLDNVAWQDGLFDDTDLDTLTDEAVDTVCTEDDDAACSTLECANDFQCQIFADSDTTDDYETGNIACTAGCCALVEEAATCPGSSSCSTNFQCQLFADDNSSDAFETDNVQCGNDGCCEVIN